MPSDDLTFGCGTYLPGAGPGQTEPFLGGGSIVAPDPDDPDPPDPEPNVSIFAHDGEPSFSFSMENDVVDEGVALVITNTSFAILDDGTPGGRQVDAQGLIDANIGYTNDDFVWCWGYGTGEGEVILGTTALSPGPDPPVGLSFSVPRTDYWIELKVAEVCITDPETGEPVYVLDFEGNLVLDSAENPIPLCIPQTTIRQGFTVEQTQFDAPTANFTGGPYNIIEGDQVSFTDASIAGAGDRIVQWDWRFRGSGQTTELDDDVKVFANPDGTNPQPTITRTYNKEGTWNVRLEVLTAEGYTNIRTKNGYVTVFAPPPDPLIWDLVELPGTHEARGSKLGQVQVPGNGGVNNVSLDIKRRPAKLQYPEFNSDEYFVSTGSPLNLPANPGGSNTTFSFSVTPESFNPDETTWPGITVNENSLLYFDYCITGEGWNSETTQDPVGPDSGPKIICWDETVVDPPGPDPEVGITDITVDPLEDPLGGVAGRPGSDSGTVVINFGQGGSEPRAGSGLTTGSNRPTNSPAQIKQGSYLGRRGTAKKAPKNPNIKRGELPSKKGVGSALTKSSEESKQLIKAKAKKDSVIDLNDSDLVRKMLKKRPTGLQDSDLFFDTKPSISKFVKNNTGYSDLFSDYIDCNVEYMLSNKRNFKDWDSTKSAGVNTFTVYKSLNKKAKELLGKIRNYDGSLITKKQIFNIIGSRILDGTISKIKLRDLEIWAKASKKRKYVEIIPSRKAVINELAALGLIDNNNVKLDPKQNIGSTKATLDNWKIMSSDIDRHYPMIIGDRTERLFVNDLDQVTIDNDTLTLEEGEYTDLVDGNTTKKFFASSEKDHSLFVSEKTKSRAIKLLGGYPGTTLSVSSTSASSIEFDSSLSSSRQNFYLLSCVLSSIDTSPAFEGSFLLKNSTMTYALMDTSSEAGLAQANEFIKYKANNRTYILNDEDLILDYVEAQGEVQVTQTDILFDAPKTNKSNPLLVRDIPKYIILYPTNRYEYNIFNGKSKITTINSSNDITRELRFSPSITPEFGDKKTNKFAKTILSGKNAVNIYGEVDSQTRINVLSNTDPSFLTGYREKGTYYSAENYIPFREKSGFRIAKEIICELDNNYEIGKSALGSTLTEFDVFSRMNLRDFTKFNRFENFNILYPAIKGGIIEGVKLVPPIGNSDKKIAVTKTQLVVRKSTATADTFASVKTTNTGNTILPPKVIGSVVVPGGTIDPDVETPGKKPIGQPGGGLPG